MNAPLRGMSQNGRELSEDALRRGYPEFKFLMETMKEGVGNDSGDAERTLSNIKKRKRGQEYSLSEHVDAMMFSLLSNQRDWGPIEQNADKIRGIFHNFDVEWILTRTPEQLKEIVGEVKRIKCGNRQIEKQIAALPENIKTLQKIAEEHGGIDRYYNETPPRDLLRALSAGQSKYKLKQMGVPLVSEYLRNVGIDLVKPDVHVTRLLGRLGYTEHSPAKDDEALDVCEKIAKVYGIYNVEVDAVLWGYCADGRLKKCTADPDCKGCKVYPCARCPKEHRQCSRGTLNPRLEQQGEALLLCRGETLGICTAPPRIFGVLSRALCSKRDLCEPKFAQVPFGAIAEAIHKPPRKGAFCRKRHAVCHF